ncbi:nucleolar protein 58 [Dendrobium catenatum]|uniref:nucleolar protein 58 n=1 Tax=Dendrobium catenatum TaxID=906689 RepID=UPI0009F55C61|nr:nucleolar protein 58 [Dendrobium catenatum]
MVLSRKKLKKKFRSLLAESLTANESKDSCKDASGATEVNNELQSVRKLLVTKSRKPKLMKREKRRKKKPVPEDLNNGDGSLEAREGNVENEDSVDLKEKIKDKKRKRVEDGGQELEEGFKQEEQKLVKKKKDKQKKKKRREKKLEKKGKKGVLGQGEENNGDEIVSTNAVNKIPEALPVQKVDESEVKKVYVGGIPYYSSVDDIRSFFEDCGTVTEVDCMTFPETGKFRGIAILSFKVCLSLVIVYWLPRLKLDWFLTLDTSFT